MDQSGDDIAIYALRLGDDALIHAQRLCEWCADAPLLEEDIAIANVGLDYLGRARQLLAYAGSRLGRTEDELAYLRDAQEFANLLIVELPRGDFAFSMVRQYLLDTFEARFFGTLMSSSDETLAAISAKTHKEIRYHVRRSGEWVRRLGLGTDESRRRAQAALDELWGYTAEFFLMDAVESRLLQTGVAPDRRLLEVAWREDVQQFVEQANLAVPTHDWVVTGGREGVHTEHLGHLLSEMQFLQRAYADLAW